MRSLYFRKQRASIYHPATIGDIPQEVLRKAFIYLFPGEADLVAPSEACRAWRPVAQDLMYSRVKFGYKGRKDVEVFVCGIHLQSLVFGLGIVSINRLELDMRFVTRENALLLAQIVAHSLSSLNLKCFDEVSGRLPSFECYEIMEVFFLHCRRIRSLILVEFDFGDDPAAISPSIKEGFGRLIKLDLSDCQGDVRMFVEDVPIRDLRKLRFESYLGEDGDVVMAMADNYRSLTSIDLFSKFDSSASFLKVFECCRDL
jgi:hypothetical protein